MPTPYALDEQVMANFADFLDAHAELGMTTIPTFLVGHMSGENWDPAWREGRDIFEDVWFVVDDDDERLRNGIGYERPYQRITSTDRSAWLTTLAAVVPST